MHINGSYAASATDFFSFRVISTNTTIELSRSATIKVLRSVTSTSKYLIAVKSLCHSVKVLILVRLFQLPNISSILGLLRAI